VGAGVGVGANVGVETGVGVCAGSMVAARPAVGVMPGVDAGVVAGRGPAQAANMGTVPSTKLKRYLLLLTCIDFNTE